MEQLHTRILCLNVELRHFWGEMNSPPLDPRSLYILTLSGCKARSGNNAPPHLQLLNLIMERLMCCCILAPR